MDGIMIRLELRLFTTANVSEFWFTTANVKWTYCGRNWRENISKI